MRLAADHFRRATEEDPKFAEAYAALAYCYQALVLVGEVPRSEADRAVEQALELDETLPDAYVTLGVIRQLHDHDWAGAEEALKRAIELDPDHWDAHREYSWLLRRMGRYAEALTEIKRAHLLDPVSRLVKGNLSATYSLLGDHDRAIEVRQRLLELYPETPGGHADIAVSLAEKGLVDEAFDELALEESLGERLGAGGYIHALAGHNAEARQHIEEAESSEELNEFGKDWIILRISEGLGDHDEAFRRLRRLSSQPLGRTLQTDLNAIPWLAPLRDDPRYHDALRRVGLEP
jgi:serine/threonine-protein kinase